MRRNRKPILTACAILLCALLVPAASAPAHALSWLSKPICRPVELEDDESWSDWKEANGGEYSDSDWIGVYYAEGTGLEIKIMPQYLRGTGGYLLDENGNVVITMILTDYGNTESPEILNEQLQATAENQYATYDSGVTLTRTTADTLQVDFAQSQIDAWTERYITLYMGITSAVFTDVETLENNAVEARWEGTWVDESQMDLSSNDRETYYAFKQLYGTSDYFCYMTFTEYGEETASRYFFLTEKGDKLVHGYAGAAGAGSGETTYVCYGMTEDKGLLQSDYVITESTLDEPLEQENCAGPYRYIANHPQWEDDSDGYFG